MFAVACDNFIEHYTDDVVRPSRPERGEPTTAHPYGTTYVTAPVVVGADGIARPHRTTTVCTAHSTARAVGDTVCPACGARTDPWVHVRDYN